MPNKTRKQIRADYYRRNREKVLASNRRWHRNNPERLAVLVKRSNAKNKASRNARSRKWRAENVERRRAYQAAWNKRNVHLTRHHNAKRRARTPKSDQRIPTFIARLKRRRSIPCYYCKAKFQFDQGEIDHIVPISKDGEHVLENLCFSCHACNHRKHAKRVGEWQPDGQQVLPI